MKKKKKKKKNKNQENLVMKLQRTLLGVYILSVFIQNTKIITHHYVECVKHVLLLYATTKIYFKLRTHLLLFAHSQICVRVCAWQIKKNASTNV